MRKLGATLKDRMPRILGGLLDLVAEVLANPVEVEELPRMGDAGKVLASVDAVLGTESLDVYKRAQDSIAEIVLEGDPVAAAVVQFMAEQEDAEWIGTASELFSELSGKTAERKQWPGNPRALSARLKRLKPAFRDAYELEVDFSRGKGRRVRLRYADGKSRKRGRGKVKAAVEG